MFISPALEELTNNSDTSGQKAVPSSVHDPASVHMAGSPSPAGGAGRSQDIDSFQQELAAQLASIDQPKLLQVKQAIQSAVQNYGDSADVKSVVQEARRRVQGALTGSTTEEEPKGAFTTVAEAVMSAGNAIGQFSTQMLGGGETDEATQRAEEAVEPLKRWWQSKESSAPTDYFTRQDQDIPGGHASHTEEAHQSSHTGSTNTSSAQHNTETSSWQNDTSEYASQGNQLQQQQQMQQGGPADNFSRSSHSQSETNTLEGDAQKVGLEEARRRARGIYESDS